MKLPVLQNVVHQLSEGSGARVFRIGFAALALLLLLVGYNWRGYHNLNNPEAMDAAQLARNLSEGKGFTTLFVRPFSIYLLKEHSEKTPRPPAATPAAVTDPARLKGNHPDLANAPLYPVVLAGLMKILPFHFAAPIEPLAASKAGGAFGRYQPDFLITLFNQLLFLGVIALVFLLAQRLFNLSVAWMSALLLLGGGALLALFGLRALNSVIVAGVHGGGLVCGPVGRANA